MSKMPIQLHSPNEMARLLADRIRAERLRREWKQETLAERSGVSLPTVRRYERTGRTSVANLLKMCHALGRLDALAGFLKPPRASSIEELKIIAEMGQPKRKRGIR
ncbi:MAG: helix-turn-helix transcriptional regulator [Phycisphaeraceae bacterium]|nr:helix-turn-helix transcriptional regulator [Phycisphaeraceae bacterium]